MEIENIVAGVIQANAIKRTKQEAGSFDKTLQEATPPINSIPVNEHLLVDVLDPLLLQDIHVARYSETALPVSDAIEGLVQLFDMYTKELGSPTPEARSLVALHEQLATLERNMQMLKKTYAEELQQKPVADIVTSLETLIVTERYKVNRGEYNS